ncbi:MAG TPA: methylated-DNA--[protein]-cysteine S-methyltransferase [Candidatus Coprenecus pullistercoris]|nr:methylated-DNA--[protein]-cysteine S-methyltransferase [Candidatus Coprenecus pullistercoris]
MPHWLFVKPRTIRTVRYQSPCGEMMLGAVGDRLCLCNWTQELHPGRVEQRLRTLLKAEFEDCGQITETTASQSWQSEGGDIPEQCRTSMPEILRRTVRELDEYFRGERREFDIPLLLAGSDFQKCVWQQLPSIPYGQTVSYGELAAAIGSPRSVRAVANANGANAISIILPCHRVIGSDGRLTGYGGGLRAKQYLLNLEFTECMRIGQTQQLSISQINNPQV